MCLLHFEPSILERRVQSPEGSRCKLVGKVSYTRSSLALERFGEFRDQQKTKNAISLGQTSPILIVRNRSREANTSTMDLAFIMFSHGNSNRIVQLRVSATMEASVAENLPTRLIFPVIEESHQKSFLASASSRPMQELTGQVGAARQPVPIWPFLAPPLLSVFLVVRTMATQQFC